MKIISRISLLRFISGILHRREEQQQNALQTSAEWMRNYSNNTTAPEQRAGESEIVHEDYDAISYVEYAARYGEGMQRPLKRKE